MGFYGGLEVAVNDADLSKNLIHGVKTSDIPSDLFISRDAVDYYKWLEVDETGTWKTAHTYVYLWFTIRNPTSKTLECNLPNLEIVSLDPETKTFSGFSSVLYNRDAFDPPPGLLNLELFEFNPDLVTMEPGETKDFFCLFYLSDEALEKAGPALCINYGYGPFETHRYRFIRLITD